MVAQHRYWNLEQAGRVDDSAVRPDIGQSQTVTWEKRLNTISLLGAAFVAGWLSSSGYYNLTTLWQQKNQLNVVQTRTVPKLQALAKCEHLRAQAAIDYADEGDPAPILDIPDCPHPKQ